MAQSSQRKEGRKEEGRGNELDFWVCNCALALKRNYIPQICLEFYFQAGNVMSFNSTFLGFRAGYIDIETGEDFY